MKNFIYMAAIACLALFTSFTLISTLVLFAFFNFYHSSS